MAKEDEQVEVAALSPKLARIAGRVERVNRQLARNEARLKNKDLDPVKRQVLSEVKNPELREELEKLSADLVVGRIEARRQSGVNIGVPVAEMGIKAKAPDAN